MLTCYPWGPSFLQHSTAGNFAGYAADISQPNVFENHASPSADELHFFNLLLHICTYIFTLTGSSFVWIIAWHQFGANPPFKTMVIYHQNVSQKLYYITLCSSQNCCFHLRKYFRLQFDLWDTSKFTALLYQFQVIVFHHIKPIIMHSLLMHY